METKTVLVLRACSRDMKSHDGFQWPESGPVSATDWQDTMGSARYELRMG